NPLDLRAGVHRGSGNGGEGARRCGVILKSPRPADKEAVFPCRGRRGPVRIRSGRGRAGLRGDPMGRFNHDDYVELTMHFRCNLRCAHCMIEGTMDRLRPESPERFRDLLAYNRRRRRWRGLILTGAEITLRHDLPDLARAARAAGFEHVRIQTHGAHLAEAAYCRELVEAGVGEFFVSVTAADAATHDAITALPRSFERTLCGLENLDGCAGVATLTNTVVTERSYRQLPALVERLSHLRRLVQMDFWNYWPMSEADDKGLVASHLDVLPFLRRALALARAH